MMNGLRGLEDLAYHIATRRRPAKPGQVDVALQWELMPGYLVETARTETRRDGELFLNRCKTDRVYERCHPPGRIAAQT
jgi:hypothetical protein